MYTNLLLEVFYILECVLVCILHVLHDVSPDSSIIYIIYHYILARQNSIATRTAQGQRQGRITKDCNVIGFAWLEQLGWWINLNWYRIELLHHFLPLNLEVSFCKARRWWVSLFVALFLLPVIACRSKEKPHKFASRPADVLHVLFWKQCIDACIYVFHANIMSLDIYIYLYT